MELVSLEGFLNGRSGPNSTNAAGPFLTRYFSLTRFDCQYNAEPSKKDHGLRNKKNIELTDSIPIIGTQKFTSGLLELFFFNILW
jgi:hypothetical protein